MINGQATPSEREGDTFYLIFAQMAIEPIEKGRRFRVRLVCERLKSQIE